MEGVIENIGYVTKGEHCKCLSFLCLFSCAVLKDTHCVMCLSVIQFFT